MFELPCSILGVRPAAPGYSKIQIRPNMGYLEWAQGEVITPKGMVTVTWKKQNDGKINLHYQVPKNTSVISEEK